MKQYLKDMIEMDSYILQNYNLSLDGRELGYYDYGLDNRFPTFGLNYSLGNVSLNIDYSDEEFDYPYSSDGHSVYYRSNRRNHAFYNKEGKKVLNFLNKYKDGFNNNTHAFIDMNFIERFYKSKEKILSLSSKFRSRGYIINHNSCIVKYNNHTIVEDICSEFELEDSNWLVFIDYSNNGKSTSCFIKADQYKKNIRKEWNLDRAYDLDTINEVLQFVEDNNHEV